MHEALWDPPTRKRERNIMYNLNIETYGMQTSIGTLASGPAIVRVRTITGAINNSLQEKKWRK